MSISRRSFLRSLLAAPFVVHADALMPVRPLPVAFLPGDLIRWRPGLIVPNEYSIMLCAEPVRRVGRDYVVVSPGFGSNVPEYKVPGHMVDLFHGLPCNRVDNPSARHRLVRNQEGYGLSYPGDVPLWKQTTT